VGIDELNRLIAASADGHTEVVRVLLAAKGDLNARDHDGKTPLHLAAGEGFTPVVGALLAGKADINAKDNDGKTPLQLAIEKNQDDTAALLRQH
jgi:ankyrin repeat protein